MGPDAANDVDINLCFDPLCSFAGMTGKCARQISAWRDYAVDWLFVSLRMINAGVDHDIHLLAGHMAGHAPGLRLLRVAARTRTEHGRKTVK